MTPAACSGPAMRHTFTMRAFAPALLLLSACSLFLPALPPAEAGEGEGDVVVGGEGEGEGDNGDAVALQVVLASTLPGQLVDDTLRLLWEVARQATALAGSQTAVVLTGTVNFRVDPPTYSAQPANQLVYLDANDIDVRFTVARFNGDFDQGTAREFYLFPHDVSITRVVTSEDDFACQSVLNANSSGSRSGSGTSAGDTFTINETVTVTTVFDQGTVDYVSVEERNGSVSNAAGTNLVFTDSARYHAFVGTSVVEDLSNDLTVSGTAGGSSWVLGDGRIQRTFRDGAAVEPDFWDATHGALKRDNADFGNIAFRSTANAFAVVLLTPGGTAVLETHAR